MNATERQTEVKLWLEMFLEKFKENEITNANSYRMLIICGSYADWLKNPTGNAPSWFTVPDLNLYILIDGSEQEQIFLEYKLGVLYSEMCKLSPINIVLDLHPFYKSAGKYDQHTIQLTSRIINFNHQQSYPDYCWFGWKKNYIVLHSKNNTDIFDEITFQHPKRNFKWLKYMYEALASYNNIVHMIALNIFSREYELVFDELFRYFKEIIKDGISLGIPIEKDEHFEYEVIKKWKSNLASFYNHFYGYKAQQIVEKIISIEEDYYNKRSIFPIQELFNDFVELKTCIYERGFKSRYEELCSDFFNENLSLPLWY